MKMQRWKYYPCTKFKKLYLQTKTNKNKNRELFYYEPCEMGQLKSAWSYQQPDNSEWGQVRVGITKFFF